MIVKSLSRKDTGFKQIIQYLYHDRGVASDYSYLHNIDANPDSLDDMVAAFKANDVFRKKRSNGVCFYHEIISFNPKDTAVILKNPDMLRGITEQYLRLRAPDALAVARPHLEKKDHIHIHFVISGNEKGSAKTLRLSKIELEKIKRDIRVYQMEQYPELKYSYHSDQEYQAEHRKSHSVWQMEQRGAIPDKRKRLQQLVVEAMSHASSWDILMKKLNAKEISLYHRKGNIAGIVWQQKKYQFSTLIKEEQTLEKVNSWNEKLRKKQETEFLQTLMKEGKEFGIPELPTDWQRIKDDLETLEKRQKLYENEKEQQQIKDMDIERTRD